jgi:hypothetical protein
MKILIAEDNDSKFSKIEDQSIDKYCNNRFRFNFIMLK